MSSAASQRIESDVILESYRCRLPLDPPFFSRGQPVHFRDAVIVHGENGEWAEAAPLPGFSRDNINEVLDDVHNRRMDGTACPSLQFARDCLSHEAWPSIDLPINALLDGPAERVTQKAQSIAKSACRCVKLKVGRTAVKEDIERVVAVRSFLRDNQSIRLDANRAWDWDAAIEFGSAVAALGVEYIEEPLADSLATVDRLESFFAATGCPYALDESLLELLELTESTELADLASRDDAMNAYESVAALVVKPTLLGSIEQIDRLAALGKPLIFSGCFESGIGTAQIARLAARFSPDIPAGLDTHSRIASDLITHPLISEAWTLRLEGRPQISVPQLQELSE